MSQPGNKRVSADRQPLAAPPQSAISPPPAYSPYAQSANQPVQQQQQPPAYQPYQQAYYPADPGQIPYEQQYQMQYGAQNPPQPEVFPIMPNARLEKADAAGRDYVLLLDTSGSMNLEDGNNGATRWKEAEEGAVAFAKTMEKLDPDGIDFCMFNESAVWFRKCTAERVEQAFQTVEPRGGTVLAPVLQEVLIDYFEERKRPLTILVVTDGAPNDKEEVIQTICDASIRLAKIGGQDADIGMSFIQVGGDQSATKFLQELDNSLQSVYHVPFDLVNTVHMDKVAEMGGIKQVLINAINE